MEIELTRIFVKVAQNGSFTRAAEILKLSKSSVSKAIARLEKETGTKLIVRTTRSLTLTASGRGFYEASLGPILQIEEAQKSLYGQDSLLTGLLRITAAEDLGSIVIAPAIAELSSKHANLNFELEYTDEVVDLVKDGFDIAIRIGKVKETNLKLKRAGEVVLVPVAAPKYLKGKNKIRSPEDLKDHDCLSINAQGVSERWSLRSTRGTVHVPIHSKIVSNQMTSLVQMAIAGGGVSLVPHYLCQTFIADGRLQRVLPEWSTPGIPVSILTPLAPSSSARLKAATDYLQSALVKALE